MQLSSVNRFLKGFLLTRILYKDFLVFNTVSNLFITLFLPLLDFFAFRFSLSFDLFWTTKLSLRLPRRNIWSFVTNCFAWNRWNSKCYYIRDLVYFVLMKYVWILSHFIMMVSIFILQSFLLFCLTWTFLQGLSIYALWSQLVY